MRLFKIIVGSLKAFGGMAALGASVCSGMAQGVSALPADAKGIIVTIENPTAVEVSHGGNDIWDQAYTNQILRAGDRLRTGERGRAGVSLPTVGVVTVRPLSLLEIPPERKPGFSLLRGVIYFFHRDKPGTFPVQTPTVSTLIRGTEFNLKVEDNGATTLTLFDGEVEMTNAWGGITLKSGEQAVVEAGQRPRPTAALLTANVIQWALYYPAVLDPAELELASGEEDALRDALSSYRSGDLLRALERYPAARQPASDAERVFFAGLLLSVGQVEKAETLLSAMPADGSQAARPAKLAGALRQLMTAVKFQDWKRTAEPELASEWLAESYHRQSRADLEGALSAALKAIEKSANFGFGWARVAELEFSFGRISKAREALTRSLAWAPRNAQAVALEGFLLAAENRISAAVDRFNEAIALDGGLGNAWLGRGLCRIRRGHAEEGLRDLEVAAALEPNRALFRSYLGKAFSNAGDLQHATNELAQAVRLDANDPTAWLYSALLNQQRNRINEAVRDLEQSQVLNENRRTFRSTLLLDKDKAARGANLASVYLDAGLVDVSTREAARAVSADYASYSAHLFLANSYNALRDPHQINLRYETPWLNEYLMANLLAPVGAGILSPVVTQQEYSKLFERDGLGLASITEYSSRGDWLQAAAQYGTYGNSAYSAEVFYRTETGDYPNNDLEQLSLSLRFKHEITPSDRLYAQVIYYNAESGDVAQHYDPYNPTNGANPTLRAKERQEPIVLAGYDHQWAPGSHTLFLAGRLQDTLLVDNGQQQTLILDRSLPPNDIQDVFAFPFNQKYRSDLTIYTFEGQQIWQQDRHTVVVGARYQTGEFETENTQDDGVNFSGSQDVSSDFNRFNVYAYDSWRVIPALLLEAGVSYDRIKFPANYRFAPVTDTEETEDQISPKAGVVWTPLAHTTIRGAYARALGGVSFDQSFQLEPSQVAGFNQAYRSLIPESAAGPVSAPQFDIWGVSFEQKLGRGTYLGLAGEWLESDARRDIGAFEYLPGFSPVNTPESLDYRERSLVFSIYQLLGEEWSFGLRYRFSRAELDRRLTEVPAIPASPGVPAFDPHQSEESSLNQLKLFTIYNHPAGFFAQLDALWTAQINHGYLGTRPGDDFWQFNVAAGYRLPLRWAELRVAVLNLTSQDYRLNPLNLTAYLPRERTLTIGLRFKF